MSVLNLSLVDSGLSTQIDRTIRRRTDMGLGMDTQTKHLLGFDSGLP